MTWLGCSIAFFFVCLCVAIFFRVMQYAEVSFRDSSIFQRQHGFRVGDLVTQTNVEARPWTLANATTRLPATHVVTNVLDSNRFSGERVAKVTLENHNLGQAGASLYLGDGGQLTTTLDPKKLPQRVGSITSAHTVELLLTPRTRDTQLPDVDFPPYVRNTIIVEPESMAVHAVLRISTVPPSVLPWFLFSSTGVPGLYTCTMKQLVLVPKNAIALDLNAVRLEFTAEEGTTVFLALLDASGGVSETSRSAGPPGGELALPKESVIDVRSIQAIQVVITMTCETIAGQDPPEAGISKLSIQWNTYV